MQRLKVLPGRGFLGSTSGGPVCPVLRGPLWFSAGVSRERPDRVVDSTRRGTDRAIQPGRCANFDGVDDRVQIPHHADFDLGTELTISCWVRASATGTFRSLVTKRGFGQVGWELAINTTGVARCVARGTGTIDCVGVGVVADDTWRHVVAVIKLSEIRLYRNGVLDRVQAGSLTPDPALNDDLYFAGRRNSSTPGQISDFYPGRLFDVRIYRRALSATEVAAIYSSSRPGGNPERTLFAGLVGHWKLDDGEKTTIGNAGVVVDSSGNERHGEIKPLGAFTRYIGDDVPFSWENEVGFSDVTGDHVPRSWSIVADDHFPAWAAATSEAKSVALTNQTWRGSTGLHAAQFLAGALAGYVNNRVTTSGASPIQLDAGKLYAMTIEVAFSRPLESGESVQLYVVGSGVGGPSVVIGGTEPNLHFTRWNRFVSTLRANDSTTTFFLAITPTANIGATDLVVYVRRVRWWDTGIASAINGYLDGQQYPERLGSDARASGHDVGGQVLTYSGKVRRNAKLKESFCGNFDGVDDVLTIPASASYPSGNAPRTITGWLYWDVTTSEADTFFQVGSQVLGGVLQFNNNTSDGGIGLAFNGARAHIVGFRPFQRWIHFAIRVPVGATIIDDVELLIDGEAMDLVVVSGGGTTLNTTADQAVYINPAGTAPMRAADVRIYDQALSDDEIRLLARGLDPPTLPVGRWPIAEGDGTTIYDVSGAGNHGTLAGATLATFWSRTEPLVHYNLRNGFRRVGGTGPRIPAVFGGSVAANGGAITHPASGWHNGAETRVDFTGGEPEAPWCDPARLGLVLPQSYAHGDALPSGMRKKVTGTNGMESDFMVVQ